MKCKKKGCWRYDEGHENNCMLVAEPKENCEEFELHKIDQEFQGVKLTDNRPKIITLCGSSRFAGHMAVMAWEFEKKGCLTFGLHLLPDDYCQQKGYTPDEEGRIHHIGEQEGVEDIMDALHFKKIEMADSIYVINVGGYIGSSTKREIAYAEYLGKPVGYLEELT